MGTVQALHSSRDGPIVNTVQEVPLMLIDIAAFPSHLLSWTRTTIGWKTHSGSTPTQYRCRMHDPIAPDRDIGARLGFMSLGATRPACGSSLGSPRQSPLGANTSHNVDDPFGTLVPLVLYVVLLGINNRGGCRPTCTSKEGNK